MITILFCSSRAAVWTQRKVSQRWAGDRTVHRRPVEERQPSTKRWTSWVQLWRDEESEWKSQFDRWSQQRLAGQLRRRQSDRNLNNSHGNNHPASENRYICFFLLRRWVLVIEPQSSHCLKTRCQLIWGHKHSFYIFSKWLFFSNLKHIFRKLCSCIFNILHCNCSTYFAFNTTNLQLVSDSLYWRLH